MKNNVILSVQDIAVIRGSRKILDVPALTVAGGEVIAVTGPNGSGKSTLLKTLCLLEEPNQGVINYNGMDIGGGTSRLNVRRKFAMVFQDPLLLRGTVADNVNIGLKLRGIPRAERERRGKYWMDKLGIGGFEKRDVRTLSGGEAQRVNLARAFALEPEVLFLDEPFTYLDAPTKGSLISELKLLLNETNTTALIVTHDLSDIPFIAERLLVLSEGQIRQCGSVKEVLNKPADKKIAEFLGVENIWPGRVIKREDKNYFAPDQGGVVLELACVVSQELVQKGKPVLGCIRPEYITVFDSKSYGQTGQDQGRYQGEVVFVQPFGYYYKLGIRLISESESAIQNSAPGMEITALVPTTQFWQGFQRGERISLSFPNDKIHLMAIN